MKKVLEKVFYILGFLLAVFLISLIFAYPIMLLWNWLMPMIFGLTKLNFWQSFGLMLLCSFLFKSSNTSK